MSNHQKNKSDIMKVVNKSKEDPVFFTHEVIGDRLWQKQRDIIKAVQNNDVSVASCHGAGKSFIASRIVLHGLSNYPGTQIITTAPTDRQVRKILWKEISTGYNNSKIPIGGKLLTKELQLDKDWFAFGFATSGTNQFQGFHAKRILVVADEAAGIPENIFRGIEGVLSGKDSRFLMIGNPTSRAGTFFQSHKESSHFKTFNISAFDTPNFIKFGITEQDIMQDTWEEKIDSELPYPKLVTPHWVRKRYLSWGPESALYQAKVKGHFPTSEEDTIVPIYLYSEAKSKQLPESNDIVAGVDPARFGSDSSALALRKGPVLKEKIWTVQKMDTTYVADWVRRVLHEQLGNKADQIPINVDTIGIGAGVADRLKNVHNMNVREFKSSNKPKDKELFTSKRTEMYWNIRELLKKGGFYPEFDDEELENQLTAIKYDYTRSGKIRAESKEKLKTRLGGSPDKADALCMCYYDAEDKMDLRPSRNKPFGA